MKVSMVAQGAYSVPAYSLQTVQPDRFGYASQAVTGREARLRPDLEDRDYTVQDEHLAPVLGERSVDPAAPTP